MSTQDATFRGPSVLNSSANEHKQKPISGELIKSTDIHFFEYRRIVSCGVWALGAPGRSADDAHTENGPTGAGRREGAYIPNGPPAGAQ